MNKNITFMFLGLLVCGLSLNINLEAAEEEPVMLFPIIKEGKWGYIDKVGKVVIEPKYSLAWDFYEGRACVGEKARRGFIDKTGKVVVKLIYGWAGKYSEGVARVNLHTKMYGEHVDWYKAVAGWTYIDKEGKRLPFTIRYGQRPGDMSEGLTWTGKNYLDMKGKKSDFDGVCGSSFSGGFAVAKKSKKDTTWGYIDHSMKFKIAPTFMAARSFSDGLAPVATAETAPPQNEGLSFQNWAKRGGFKWGFINTSGEIVVKQIYEDAWLFSEGLGPVKTKGKWGFIDKSGKMVIQPEYDYVWPFSEGMARVLKGEKQGYVDKTGKLVIETKYDAAWEFNKGLARVGMGNKEGYIDTKGSYVWEPTE